MTSQILRNLLDDIVKELNYEKPNVDIKSVSTGGANYTSDLYTAKVSEAGKEDLHLFAKVVIIGEAVRAQMLFAVFDIERKIYVDILSEYEKLQIKHDVPPAKRLIMPKFYGSNPKVYEETVVLEDLTVKGFTTYDRFKSIDWDYASKAVESLARLHALSIAHKEENPEKYNTFVDSMSTQSDAFHKILNIFYGQRIETTLAVTAEKHKNKLKKYLETELTTDFIIKLIQTCQRRVLCHGDYRPSNLMHRVNEKGILEVVPVDYQTIQPNSPITDLFYLIFTGSDEEFRRKHFQQLLDLYYEEFSSALRLLKVNPDIVYPKRDYELE
ncbi:uncharacterized protein ACR2FA_006496 [Aphomia sociella]